MLQPKISKPALIMLILLVSIIGVALLSSRFWLTSEEPNSFNQDLSPKYETLIAKARNDGLVDVLVELDVDYHVENMSNEDQAQQQIDRLSLVIDQLLNDLGPYNFIVNYQSQTWIIPYIALSQ